MQFKRYLSILSVAALSLQPVATCATTLTTSVLSVASTTATSVPNEVLAAESYVEVPVYFNGQIANAVTTYLEKTCNAGNANEIFISGYATVSAKAYAYKTGSDIKVGATISYLSKDGKMVTDWWDNIEQFSTSDAITSINWPTCDQYALNLSERIVFEMPDQNENDLRLSLTLSGVKSSFTRPTNQGVSLSEDDTNTDSDDIVGDEDVTLPTPTPDTSFDNASGLDPEYF